MLGMRRSMATSEDETAFVSESDEQLLMSPTGATDDDDAAASAAGGASGNAAAASDAAVPLPFPCHRLSVPAWGQWTCAVF